MKEAFEKRIREWYRETYEDLMVQSLDGAYEDTVYRTAEGQVDELRRSLTGLKEIRMISEEDSAELMELIDGLWDELDCMIDYELYQNEIA